MKKLLGCFLCVMLLTFGAQAHALSITPSMSFLSGPETSQSDINDLISSYTGGNDELYKAESNPYGESGVLAGSYATVFFATPTDPSGATITYTGGDIVGQPAYLLVKDGNHNPGWYFFNLGSPPPTPGLGWNGMETLALSGFWPAEGAISHVSLYGERSVPEPATMLLLGTGLVVLAGFGRKKFLKLK